MVFKCKMCGGELEIEKGTRVGTCQYCGSKQTLPKLDDDKRTNLYERANHHRRQNEFDKAATIYESLLNEDQNDAEAYWSLILCKYGVEYVKDPATGQRVPTCNRTQFGSVLVDEDYKQALSHADEAQRSLYTAEAAVIDGIQKGILEISSKEEPFDIFICYKETDDQGDRTPDSVLAQDLYHQLTDEGFKVFFARITLENKLGSAYEPYIFAALQSSRIMVALGTKQEYFNAVWVKNEWSRYLALIKGGAKKTLIPAYRDMDPYLLPEEFSHLQALDMGKLGFMQDLVRGIKKILSPSQIQSAVPPVSAIGTGGGATALLQRAYIELEDGNWQKADDLLEQVLNIEPQNAKAYIAKLMASLGVARESGLGEANSLLDENKHFQKALRFADENYQKVLRGYATAVQTRLGIKHKQEIYDKALEATRSISSSSTESDSLFESAQNYRNAAAMFRTIPGFLDADEMAEKLETRATSINQTAEETQQKAQLKEKRKKRAKKAVFLIVISIISFVVIGGAILFDITDTGGGHIGAAIRNVKQSVQDKKYKENAPAALELFMSGKTSEAMDAFNTLGGYKIGGEYWRILAIKDDKALLITQNVMESRKFNDKDALVTWENSTLRNYLNTEFLTKQFTEEEQKQIAVTTLSNASYGKIGGNPTRDKVFLLTVEEATKYFKDNDDRIALTKEEFYPISWWLRSPSTNKPTSKTNFKAFAACVGQFSADGTIDTKGRGVDFIRGVRPAIWITLK